MKKPLTREQIAKQIADEALTLQPIVFQCLPDELAQELVQGIVDRLEALAKRVMEVS